MADLTEPKKETVRIALPPQPEVESPRPRDTVRINLPSRPPANGPVAAVALPVAQPTAHPKKETARITILPGPPSQPPMQMKKTQPLIDMPASDRPQTQLVVTPEPGAIVRTIPKSLCWAVLGTSTTILIIEIWSYFS